MELNWGSEWSERMMSGLKSFKAFSYSSFFLTTLLMKFIPPRFNSRSTRSRSSGESSRINIFKGVSILFSCSVHVRSLVQQQPVKSKVRHRFDEIVKVDGLYNVTVYTQRI